VALVLGSIVARGIGTFSVIFAIGLAVGVLLTLGVVVRFRRGPPQIDPGSKSARSRFTASLPWDACHGRKD